jgi:hypothetical protein
MRSNDSHGFPPGLASRSSARSTSTISGSLGPRSCASFRYRGMHLSISSCVGGEIRDLNQTVLPSKVILLTCIWGCSFMYQLFTGNIHRGHREASVICGKEPGQPIDRGLRWVEGLSSSIVPSSATTGNCCLDILFGSYFRLKQADEEAIKAVSETLGKAVNF